VCVLCSEFPTRRHTWGVFFGVFKSELYTLIGRPTHTFEMLSTQRLDDILENESLIVAIIIITLNSTGSPSMSPTDAT
jgi:hypothetical protein